MPSSLYITLLLCLISGLWNGATAEGEDQLVDDDCCERCPSGWTQLGDNCYQFFFAKKDWTDAEVACIAAGGNLASVQNIDQYNFIKQIINRVTGKDEQTWIGGHDATKEGKWLWSDGSKFDFKFWGAGEPNNSGGAENCMGINFNGNANDEGCQKTKSFICGKHL